MEKEIKLLSSPAGRRRIFNLPIVKAAMIAGSRRNVALWNGYYDTEDQKLTRAGMAYRVRCTDHKVYEATLKTRGRTAGGFSERGEYTVPLVGNEPVWQGFSAAMDTKLATLLADDEPHVIVTVEFVRKIALLQLSAGTVAELAVDSGMIRAGDNQAPVEEIEIELKKGSERDLMQFVAALSGNLPLYPEERSKFTRGLNLLEVPVGPVSSVPLLTPEMDALDGWLALLRNRLASALDLLGPARGKKTPEERLALLYGPVQDSFGLWLMGEEFLSQRAFRKGKQILARLLADAEQGIVDEEMDESLGRLHAYLDMSPLESMLRHEQAERIRKQRRDYLKGSTASDLWNLLALTYSLKRTIGPAKELQKYVDLEILRWYQAAQKPVASGAIEQWQPLFFQLQGLCCLLQNVRTRPLLRFLKTSVQELKDGRKCLAALLLGQTMWQQAHKGRDGGRRLAAAALSGYAYRRGEKHGQKVRKYQSETLTFLEKKVFRKKENKTKK
jgi:inorganic triphosphatase YgiF